MSSLQVGAHLFLQLAIILCACRVLGWLGVRFLRQTQVFMEMVAGVLLGPSLLGVLSEDALSWLFPREMVLGTLASGEVARVAHPNMSILYAIAQIGLVLYMFVIGLEFDLSLLRGKLRSAALVSSAGIAVPFLASAVMLPVLLRRTDLWGGPILPWIAWLFVGASVSITAFPMLARILYERGIAGTSLGTVALAAGSIDDAIAWCLLALVTALFGNTPEKALLTIGGGIAYGTFMLTVGRKLLARLFTYRFSSDTEATSPAGLVKKDAFGTVMVLLMVCAWFTDHIGIYAVFGAFICGAALPKVESVKHFALRIERLTITLLLPVFFVYSGLNTRIALLASPELWGLAAVVALVSTVGKGLACAVAARLSGENWRESSMLGVLMNARGLMELILLNVGLERGIITPTFFTIMVMMAIVTTGMASPLYDLLAKGLSSEAGGDLAGKAA
jgi:Kef-type K+ transport system membrane component KefB